MTKAMATYHTPDNGKVEIVPRGHVAIYDNYHGDEIVRWVVDEFEDPEAATAMANSVALALTEGAAVVRDRIGSFT